MRHLHVFVVIGVACVQPATALAQEPAEQAREENRLGLAAHARENFEEARRRFEHAVQLDPTLHVARFNAACAAARQGDVDAAVAHAVQYVRDQPTQATRVLHDADLTVLWQDEARLRGLREHMRPVGARVREILFERRDIGELFVIGDDGLDERQLTRTPDRREHDAQFVLDGARLLFEARSTTGEDPRSPNFSEDYFTARYRQDEQLASMSYPAGEITLLGEYVQWHQLAADGRSVLFVDQPTRNGSHRLRRVEVTGGEAETLGEIDGDVNQFCAVLEPAGTVLLATGQSPGWGSTALRVVRYADGTGSEVYRQPNRVAADRRFDGISRCALSADGTSLDLGHGIVHLGDTARLQPRPDGPAADGYYTRGIPTAPERQAPPARWKVSRMSYGNDWGMADFEDWSRTAIFRRTGGGEPVQLTREGMYLEYGPALSSDGEALAFTRLRSRTSDPWIIVSRPGGTSEHPVVPGQFPVFSPFVHTVADAGAPIAFGPELAPEPAPSEPIAMPVADPAAAAERSGCDCSVPGPSKPTRPEAVVLLALLAFALRRRTRR